MRVKHPKKKRASTELPIIGVTYNLTANTSSLPFRFFSSLACRVRKTWGAYSATKRTVSEIIGVLVFCNHAYPGSLHLLSDLFSFAHRLTCGWGDTLSASEQETFQFLALVAIDAFAAMPACALQSSLCRPELVWSDATPRQLGVLLEGVFYAERIPPVNIFVAEAEGLSLALDLSHHIHNITFIIDNKPLYHAVRKGWSPVSTVNLLIGLVLQRRLAGDTIFIKWVPSEKNPADFPSRAKGLDLGYLYQWSAKAA